MAVVQGLCEGVADEGGATPGGYNRNKNGGCGVQYEDYQSEDVKTGPEISFMILICFIAHCIKLKL
jgi:hypothetical protein